MSWSAIPCFRAGSAIRSRQCTLSERWCQEMLSEGGGRWFEPSTVHLTDPGRASRVQRVIENDVSATIPATRTYCAHRSPGLQYGRWISKTRAV
jgi:hypothetical protein